jgi:C4-dicarboxylate transporter, DctQ subunit
MRTTTHGYLQVADRGIAQLENHGSVLSLAAIVVLVCAQVFYRYVLYDGIVWADEVIGVLMVVMVMFGSARGMREGEHTDLQSLVDALPSPVRTATRVLTAAATIVFLLIVLFSSLQHTLQALHLTTIMIRIPMWLCYGMLPLGFLLMLYEFLRRLRIWVFRDPGQAAPDQVL